jgi:RNA polymerase sigma-70 factor (ECF subfamily)
MELEVLLDRCRSGDELAWEALVRQYQAKVYGISYHYMGNAEDARDLAQEVFIKVYRQLRRCPDPHGFLPWLIRITRNCSIDQLRRRRVRPQAARIPADEMLGLQDQRPDPEESWISESRKGLLARALQCLGAFSREMIILKEIQGLTLDEISLMLKIPIGTVKSRSHRARIELARQVLLLSEKLGTG